MTENRNPVPLRQRLYNVKAALNDKLGRVVFGNATTFSRNVRGRAAIVRCRWLTRPKPNQHTNIDVTALKTVGYLKLPYRIDPDVVDVVQKKFEQLIDDLNHPDVIENAVRDGVNYSMLLRDVALKTCPVRLAASR